MNQTLSQNIFMQSLEYLIDHPNRLEDFCTQNGSTIADIRTHVNSADFQASLLDYFLNNQEIAFELFKYKNINSKEFIKARHYLPGSDRELVSL